jgi:hypothetical protein
VCAVSYKTVEQAARMFETNVRVISLEPNTIADIFANIRTVGSLTNRDAEAAQLVAELTTRLDSLALALADTSMRPRTFVLEWLEPPFAPGHWVPEQIAFAGGDHTFGHAGQPSTTTTAEEISAYAPEVIVLAPCGYYKEDIMMRLRARAFPPVGKHFRRSSAARSGRWMPPAISADRGRVWWTARRFSRASFIPKFSARPKSMKPCACPQS